jgi:predicted enzyme related to lactoylglutathione lyase
MWSPEGVEPRIELVYRVDDLAAALVRVRAAGGIAGEAEHKPYGLKASCADDQGVAFELWQPND